MHQLEQGDLVNCIENKWDKVEITSPNNRSVYTNAQLNSQTNHLINN